MPRQLFPHERQSLALQIKGAIDEYCRVTYDDGHRSHLGASLIGDVCLRRLWYGFRWVQGSKFGGRMQRLFNRGHREEARWIEWLRGIGFKIWDQTDDGKQYRIGGVEGHFGGSLDSVGIAPEGLTLLYEVGPFLVEYKTYNEKTFAKLVKDGVQRAKPNHWVQMCTYGAKYGFRYAMYCAICKNDDEIEIQIVELDWNVAKEAERKAESVITSQQPPLRFSELSTHMECKFCDFNAICHKGGGYDKNCRSCQAASPIKNGEWFCANYGKVIPNDVIPVGCPAWKAIGRG